MIGQQGGHGGGLVVERRMSAAKIVNGTEQKNALSDGLLSACQAVRAANERSEIGAEGTIQPLDESRINRASALRALAEVDEHGTQATQDVAREAEAALDVLLDDLSQGQARPDLTGRATACRFVLVGESAFKGVGVACQAIKGVYSGSGKAQRRTSSASR